MTGFLPSNLAVITPDTVERVTQLAFLQHPWGVNSVAFSPNDSLLATGYEAARLWLLETGLRDMSLQAGDGVIQSLSFNPNGHLIAAAYTDGVVRLWGVSVGVQMGILRSHRAILKSVAYSPDSVFIAAGSGDFSEERPEGNVVHLWDSRANWSLTTLDEPTSEVQVAFSPDGSLLAGGEQAGCVWLWQVDPLERLGVLEMPNRATNYLFDLAFNPNGAILAACGSSSISEQGGIVCLWWLDTGELWSALIDQSRAIYGLAFNPVGSLLATGGEDAVNAPSTLRLWDARAGVLRLELPGHTRPITSVAFNAAGTLIATGGGDGVRLWGVR